MMRLRNDRVHMQHDCRDGDRVTLSGSGNTVHVAGNCIEFRIDGNANIVQLAAVDEIVITGNENLVGYEQLNRAKELRSRSSGTGNLIQRSED